MTFRYKKKPALKVFCPLTQLIKKGKNQLLKSYSSAAEIVSTRRPHILLNALRSAVRYFDYG